MEDTSQEYFTCKSKYHPEEEERYLPIDKKVKGRSKSCKLCQNRMKKILNSMKRSSIYFECEGNNHEGEMHIMKKSKDEGVISKNICKACMKKDWEQSIPPHDITEQMFYCTNKKIHIGERYLPVHERAHKGSKICKTCYKYQEHQRIEDKNNWLQKQKDDGTFFECKDPYHEGPRRTSYNYHHRRKTGKNNICDSCIKRRTNYYQASRRNNNMLKMEQQKGNQIDEEQFNHLSLQPCYFCNRTPQQNTFFSLFVLDSTKTRYDSSNLKPCCGECFVSRKSMSIESYIQKCKDITFFQDLGVSPKTFIPHQQGRTTVCFAGCYALYKRRDDGRKNKEFLLTKEAFKSIRKEACVYCGWGNKRHIGIDRIDSNQGYTVDNIVPACTTCNLMKYKFTKDSFLERCYRITHNQNRN